jgi:prevent-host-death family protein
MIGECFQTLDVARFRGELEELVERVGCGKGRVEVTCPGRDDVCVLISKAELDSLERALQILAATLTFKQMSDHIAEIVAAINAGTPLPQTPGSDLPL